MTAVEAISDKLAEVTSLAEELDAALCGEATALNMDRILDGTASTTPEVNVPQATVRIIVSYNRTPIIRTALRNKYFVPLQTTGY